VKALRRRADLVPLGAWAPDRREAIRAFKAKYMPIVRNKAYDLPSLE
jgi:hypothetical protein